MAYLIIVILITVFFFLFTLTGCQRTSRNKPTIEELARRGRENLRKYAIEEAGDEYKIGACCYVPANFRSREFVCPVCGKVTKYIGSLSKSYPELGLYAQYRLEILAHKGADRLNGSIFKLNETQFCRFCNPNITEPKLGLTVHHPGGKVPHYIYGINEEDLVLICEYILGRKTHSYGSFIEPIEKHYNRLNELLDLNLKMSETSNN